MPGGAFSIFARERVNKNVSVSISVSTFPDFAPVVISIPHATRSRSLTRFITAISIFRVIASTCFAYIFPTLCPKLSNDADTD